VSNTFCFYCIC